MSLNNSIIEECLALCECDFLKNNQTYDLEAKIKDDEAPFIRQNKGYPWLELF